MPFAIGDLAILAWVVFLFALGVAIIEFGEFLAHLVPKLPFIGNWLANEILNISSGAGNYVISKAQGSYHYLKELVIDMAHIDAWLFRAVVSAIDHVQQQASYLFHSGIPAAQQAAQEYARQQATNEQSRASAVESTLTHDLANAKSAEASFEAWVQGTYHDRLETDIANARTAATSTAEAKASADLATLQADLMQRLSNVWAAITPLQTAVVSTIPAEIAAEGAKEASDIAAEASTRVASLSSAVKALEGQIATNDAKQTAALSAASAAAAAASAADLSTAEGQAAADEANAEVVAQQAIANQAKSDAAALNSAVGVLQGQITTLQQTQTLTLPALPDVSIPGTIAVPVAVGALAAAVVGVITEVDTCMVSACGGPNSLANELQKLESLFVTTGELSFLAAAIKDPIGTEQAIDAVLNGVFDTGQSAFDALLAL